ncbi:MAG TPA: OB-fold domain-containing protein [Nocardioides sp.]|nr:OB-fold domain-containing protein [Nocardioides sp.]
MSGPVRPVINRDNAYFFEGTAIGELRIQTCNACGALRHPPGPACPDCGAFDRGHVVAAGTGTVFSYLVHHAPQVPGKELPLVIALVDLDEGVRMVAEMTGPVEIGDRVQVGWNRIDDELTLPLWRLDTPRSSATRRPEVEG